MDSPTLSLPSSASPDHVLRVVSDLAASAQAAGRERAASILLDAAALLEVARAEDARRYTGQSAQSVEPGSAPAVRVEASGEAADGPADIFDDPCDTAADDLALRHAEEPPDAGADGWPGEGVAWRGVPEFGLYLSPFGRRVPG